MRVFSPSATEDFLTCPLYWQLRRRGLQPSRLGKKELSGILGTAFAAAVGAHNLGCQNGIPQPPSRLADIAEAMVNQHLRDADEAGLVTEDVDRVLRDSLARRARKAITEFVSVDPRPPGWTITDVELTMEEAGNSRLDLACTNELGPIVLDYKTKITADERWLPRDVERWKYSEQRWHYSYFYGQRVGKPVWQFVVCLVILEPRFRAHWFNWPNHPETLNDWYDRRLVTWERMAMVADEEIPAEMAAQHATQFGPCQYRRHCFDHHGDLTLSSTSREYIVKETS